MKGKNYVAIASDKRLGAQALTVSMNFPKAFPVSENVYIGLSGLASDIQTLYAQILNFLNLCVFIMILSF